MATRVLNASAPVEVFSPGGVYLGDAMGYEVDLPRINRVLSRIVRGIYFRERDIPVPQNALAQCFVEPPPWVFHRDTIEALLALRRCRVANGAFEYWFSSADDRPDSAVILMRFFGGVLALGFVMDSAG